MKSPSRTLPAVAAAAFLSAIPAFPQGARPACGSISAERVSHDKIRVTWSASADALTRPILVFRDERPIRRLDSLEPVAELPPGTTTYTDTVKFYGFYCYAVAVRLADGSVEKLVVPAVNASADGVRISREERKAGADGAERTYPEGTLREQPLPRIAMFEREPRRRRSIGEDARKGAQSLASPAPVRRRLAPHVFEEDLVAPSGGDGYLLFEILKTSFIRKDYGAAAEKLTEFLRVNREEGAANRAAFYLAESYHFTGDQKRAVAQFLRTAEAYPALSRKWIDASLDEYEMPE